MIATPVGDVSRIVDHEKTGYVVPFDDIDAMASRMVRLATSPSLRSHMGEAGRARVEQSYSYQTLGGRLLDTYRLMAETQRHRRALAVVPQESQLLTHVRPHVRGMSYTTR